jgi:hypothetical protein
MSFSIMTLTPSVSASDQVKASFLANVDNANIEGRLLKMCIVDGGLLKIRDVQAGLGMTRTPVNNTTQIALTTGVPSVISLAGSFLESASVNFDSSANSNLRFIGTDQPAKCFVKFSCTAYSTVNNQQITFQLLRNGVVVNGCSATTVCSNGLATAQNISLHHIVNVTTNDIFTISVTNATASNPIIIYNSSLSAIVNFM